MAVEEIVKENTPKAEGEAQGVKYISLTEEELERLIKAAGREGAKKGVEAYERRKEKDKEELADKVKNSAKTIIIHYRQLKKMKNTSVTGTDTVTDPTLKEILDGILEQVRKEEFNLTSTNKNRIVTGMLLNHVDVQLENYKKECRKSKIQDIQRRYRVVERMNADLASKNYYVILGRVPTRYVEDKIYGLEHVEQYLKEDKAV